MKIKTLDDLYVHELRDLYYVEKTLVRALGKMAKAAEHPDLRQAFLDHQEETRVQMERLERIFESMDMTPKAKKCQAMDGLLAEAEESMENVKDADVLDAALICAAQRVEHYEIAAYGCARAFAARLGDENAVELLNQSIQEEGATDQKLTQLAESMINAEAQQADDAMEGAELDDEEDDDEEGGEEAQGQSGRAAGGSRSAGGGAGRGAQGGRSQSGEGRAGGGRGTGARSGASAQDR
jgi:ferritin-like metal-binding protein YciE